MTTPDEVQSRGPFVAEYSGVGRFTYAGDHLSEDVRFWVGQAHNGNIVICYDEGMSAYVFANLFSPLARFSGLTTSRLCLETHGPLYTIHGQPLQSDESTLQIIVLASEIGLTVAEPPAITGVRYGLTNFLFSGTESRELEHLHWQRVLPLKLDYQGKSVAGYICEAPNYSSARNTLHAVGGIQVTAELVINLNLSEITGDDCDRIADVLCRVLSVARGTHIAWIYKVSLDSTGNPVTRVHSNNVTRDYHDGLPLLTDSPDDAEPTRVLAETTFPAYIANSSQYMLHRGSLDTYLEGKSGGEYLEMRALKLAVAMEMLAARPVAPQLNQIIDTVVFEGLIRELSSSICDIVLSATKKKKKAKRISDPERLRVLNQRSLGERIQRMWKDIKLNRPPKEKDAENFARSRNCLAHTGSFACSPENRATWDGPDMPWSTPVDEYGFLVSLLDRTILRILNYDGPYTDWRNLNDPKRRMHVKE